MSRSQARAVLGVPVAATPGEIRRAFREAAKQAHPDRPGGGAERFRQVMAAYQRLSNADTGLPVVQAPAGPATETGVIAIATSVAIGGGEAVYDTPGARRFRINLPPGMRAGDKVRAGSLELTIAVEPDAAILIRGDDLWITAEVDPKVLAQGGRVAVDTPLGRRIVWITRKAGERGLVRLVGQGLPARGRHREGHLFLRLSAQAGEVDSAARALLRRFQAAWAA